MHTYLCLYSTQCWLRQSWNLQYKGWLELLIFETHSICNSECYSGVSFTKTVVLFNSLSYKINEKHDNHWWISLLQFYHLSCPPVIMSLIWCLKFILMRINSISIKSLCEHKLYVPRIWWDNVCYCVLWFWFEVVDTLLHFFWLQHSLKANCSYLCMVSFYLNEL
jgi:hypothetical protein